MDSMYDDPRLYDLLFLPEPHLSFYRKVAQDQTGSVLEIACGSGQLLVPIAERGFRSVGIDLHPAMVTAARNRARAARADVSFLEADMRDFALAERFSLVFIARNSLLHLHTQDDFTRCFGNVREHLERGGVFAFDIFNPDVSILARTSGARQNIARVEHPERGWINVEATSDYDRRSQVNRATWFASSESEPDFLVAPLHLRCIFPEELTLLLDSSGFELEARYGDFSLSLFDSASARQVCLCRAV